MKELETADPGSFNFRYPLDKKLRGSIGSHFTFSVREFARIMDDVLNTLDGACFCLPDECNARAEADYEASQRAEEWRFKVPPRLRPETSASEPSLRLD